MSANELEELTDLLNACRDGDALAWESLVRQYQGRIYGMAFHFVGDVEEARDIAQLVFVRIYSNLHLCADARMFHPWILRITRNACIDQLRRQKARPPAFDIPAERAFGLEDGAESPEERTVRESRRQLLRSALLLLGTLNREVILLREIQGLTLEETATVLGKPIGTIKSRLHRARLELAEIVRSLSRGDSPKSVGEGAG